MTVDVNALFGAWGLRTPGIRDGDEFVRCMDAHGIDIALISPLRGLVDNTRAGNAEVRHAARERPDRLRWAACINPAASPSAGVDELTRARDAGCSGLRLYPPPHHYSLSDRSLLEPLMEAADGLPVVITVMVTPGTQYGTTPLSQVDTFLSTYSQVPTVLSGINYGDLPQVLRMLEQCPKALLEISLLQGAEGVRTVVQRIGHTRVLLGTGMGLFYPAVGAAKVRTADISDAAKQAILGDNAAALLGIAAP